MSKSSQDITAGMVMVSYEDHEQQAFTAWMAVRIQRAKEWDIQPTNPLMGSYQSEPGMADSVVVDEDLSTPKMNETQEDMTVSLQGFEDF